MTNKNNEKLDQLIYKSIKIDDKPTKKLNDSLKAQLYEKENTFTKEKETFRDT